jgi:RimJ/RimL family protein N-acetyltransferase
MLCAGEELRPFLEAALATTLPQAATFIGRLTDGELSEIAGFCNWVGHDAEVHLWCSGTLHRDFLRRIGRYAFDEMGCQRITCRVAGDSHDWHAQLERMGFVREGRLRGGFDGQIDLLIFGIKRDEYRYGK